MRLHRANVKNFRLLADVELLFEEQTTVIVGRNNSGKTSLSEVMRRFLDEAKPSFRLEDFSSACYDGFCAALEAHHADAEENVVRDLLPAVELRLVFTYDPNLPQFGPLSPFIVDLDPDCAEAVVLLRYGLKDGGIADLFADQPPGQMDDPARVQFFRTLRERVPALFELKVWAEDPNDPTNRKSMTIAAVRHLVRTGFVNAQRGLDDVTSRETDVLAKILESLFATASSPTADANDQAVAEALALAVQEIQAAIDADFAGQLQALIPTFQTFGYPGLGGPELQTETTLDVRKLLSNHTKVRYAGHSGVTLPESYNGLGARNLIFILLQLVGFYKSYRADAAAAGVHLIFIEEPEAHLHPQMQEVFIKQLGKLTNELIAGQQDVVPWPVQFVVSTHSSHVANAAGFEAIRYFLAEGAGDGSDPRHTKIKDLRQGLSGTPATDRQFLHQYLTLTRCDLFFADKAALVEGLSERLLLPIIIEKAEAAEPDSPKLSSQYLTIMEVGGAYAHLFLGLLDFLELRHLIITDLDSVIALGGVACAPHQGAATSNACIRAWFGPAEVCTPANLIQKVAGDKVRGRGRIAYQHPEETNGPCGRTLEDAFILANPQRFAAVGDDAAARELNAREIASKLKKSEFALKHAITDKDWIPPRYIVDGIRWLAEGEALAAHPALAMLAAAAAAGDDAHG